MLCFGGFSGLVFGSHLVGDGLGLVGGPYRSLMNLGSRLLRVNGILALDRTDTTYGRISFLTGCREFHGLGDGLGRSLGDILSELLRLDSGLRLGLLRFGFCGLGFRSDLIGDGLGLIGGLYRSLMNLGSSLLRLHSHIALNRTNGSLGFGFCRLGFRGDLSARLGVIGASTAAS